LDAEPSSRFDLISSMKGLLFALLFFLNINVASAQDDFGAAFSNENYADSVLQLLPAVTNDTTKVILLNSLGGYYKFVRQDSSIYFYEQSLKLAEQINYTYGIYKGYLEMALVLNIASNYGKALEMAVLSLRTAETLQTNREYNMAGSYCFMASINRRLQNDSLALSQIRESIHLYALAGVARDKISWASCIIITGIYAKLNMTDSVLYYANASYRAATNSSPRQQANISISDLTLGAFYLTTGKTQLAHACYLHALENEKNYNAPLVQVRILNELARFFKATHQTDSCIYYAKMALRLCENHQFGEHATFAANLIASSYELIGKPDSALKYTKIYIAARDTIISQSKLLQIDLLNFDEAQRQKEIQRKVDEAQERYANRIRYYTLFSAAAIFLLISLLLYRNNRSKQIANKSLELQKKEIDLQRAKAEETLHELKSTQAMLIQSEKMASLGDLTAGIAHEIQNPLNFVNNFSEINQELLEEASEELDKGNIDLAKTMIKDVINNEGKINHHGKRADAIVKGMLLHSRTSTGQKEPVDINDLTDEYLRLSYHGLRAKEKSFNAHLETDYDKSIGLVNVIPQDIGRALLNLCNNAFYAVSEKQRLYPGNYEPTVSVKTKKTNNKVEISVKDNGNGISQKYIDKIFLPFFTTKPVGQGTGLGLSMSFDLIKAQGGELKVKTKEGEGTEFLIQILVV
jgi:two-component system, NtrC family, sensor kinase